LTSFISPYEKVDHWLVYIFLKCIWIKKKTVFIFIIWQLTFCTFLILKLYEYFYFW
jgi:hypothetical protein